MRYRRANTPGATYFFTVVTHERKNILCHGDNPGLLRKVFEAVRNRHPFTVDAIVLLPDHLHCLWTLPPGDGDFSKRWMLIKSAFTRTCGDPLHSVPCPSREKKSGHSVVMSKKECPWMDTDYALLQFNDTKRKARNAYRQFVHEGFCMGRKPELTGGGLVRSLGGWSQVQSSQRKGQKMEYDERILGSGDFVTDIFKEAEEKQIRQFKIKRTGLTIAGIIERECKTARISEKELKNGSKRMIVRNVREKIARRGVEELGLPSAEIARNLGVCTSTITRALTRSEAGA